MGEISMSGSTREREAAVIGPWAFHSVLSSLPYRLGSQRSGMAGRRGEWGDFGRRILSR